MGIEGEEHEDTDEEKETEYSCVIIAMTLRTH